MLADIDTGPDTHQVVIHRNSVAHIVAVGTDGAMGSASVSKI